MDKITFDGSFLYDQFFYWLNFLLNIKFVFKGFGFTLGQLMLVLVIFTFGLKLISTIFGFDLFIKEDK